MRGAIRLGRIRGISVSAHWSIVLIGSLLALSLADVTLPDGAPGSSTAAYWIVALVIVCLFWASLLAHELAHSIVAVHAGLRVEGITLWLLGGVSRLGGEPPDPSTELRISLAGPATSFAAAALWGGLALIFSAFGASKVLVLGVAWLALINILLALFNLVPAAPLDGGRVLHALLWKRSGDRAAATISATNAGRVFGYVLIGLGVVVVLAGDLSGLWFALLGWFLLGTARAEATHVLVQDALAGIRVQDVMTAAPVTAASDVTIDALLDEFVLRHQCSAFPLVDPSGRVVGLVSLRQIREVPVGQRATLRADAVGWPIDQVPHAAPREPLMDLLDRMSGTEAGGGRSLVFDGKHLVGIVSPTDVNRALEIARLRPGSRGPAHDRAA